MVWGDLKYAVEQVQPFGQNRPLPDKVTVDDDLLGFYRTWIKRRGDLPVLRRGDIQIVLTDDSTRIFAFRRRLGKASAIALFNAGDQAVTIPLFKLGITTREGWRNDKSPAPTEIEIPAHWFVMLEHGTGR